MPHTHMKTVCDAKIFRKYNEKGDSSISLQLGNFISIFQKDSYTNIKIRVRCTK